MMVSPPRSSRLFLLCGPFHGQLLVVRLFVSGELRLEGGNIAEARGIVGIARLVDRVQVELARMRRQPDVRAHALKAVNGIREVLHDRRIARRAQELHAVVDARHVGDQHVVGAAVVLDREREAGRARRVARAVDGRDLDAAQPELVAVLQALIDLDRIVDDAAAFGPAVIEIAARIRGTGASRSLISTRALLTFWNAAKSPTWSKWPWVEVMILMSVSLKPRSSMLFFIKRVRAFRTRIDQDQALVRSDQVACEVVGADIVEVADDLEARKRLLPLLVGDRQVDALLGVPGAGGGDGDKSGGEQEPGFHGSDLPGLELLFGGSVSEAWGPGNRMAGHDFASVASVSACAIGEPAGASAGASSKSGYGVGVRGYD